MYTKNSINNYLYSTEPGWGNVITKGQKSPNQYLAKTKVIVNIREEERLGVVHTKRCHYREFVGFVQYFSFYFVGTRRYNRRCNECCANFRNTCILRLAVFAWLRSRRIAAVHSNPLSSPGVYQIKSSVPQPVMSLGKSVTVNTRLSASCTSLSFIPTLALFLSFNYYDKLSSLLSCPSLSLRVWTVHEVPYTPQQLLTFHANGGYRKHGPLDGHAYTSWYVH